MVRLIQSLVGTSAVVLSLVGCGQCEIPQGEQQSEIQHVADPNASIDEEQVVRPPNLVVILSDDQGYWDVGFNGGDQIPTPHTDRIAAEGVRFTNGYVTGAVCGPSRAGLITGRYQDRFGAVRNPTVDPSVPNNGVPTSELNIAELLEPAGYTSMVVGKWHVGSHPDLRPMVRGFDEFFGFLSGGHDYTPERLTIPDLESVTGMWGWYLTKLLRNEERVEIDDYLTDELSDAAVDFINRQQDEPFFLYLAYNAPHTPMQATQEYLGRFPDIDDDRRRTYAAMVSAMDDGIGRVLDALEANGLEEDTIVIFLSDNGGAWNNAARNWPLRGHKGAAFEGGIRVPFAMRWPGVIPAGSEYDPMISSLDIAATIVSQANLDAPTEKPLDGVDLVPFLTGEAEGVPHEVLFWRWFDDGRYAVRMQDWKLIMPGPTPSEPYTEPMLFDLSQDVGESENVYAEHPEVAERALRLYQEWESEQATEALSPGLGFWQLNN